MYSPKRRIKLLNVPPWNPAIYTWTDLSAAPANLFYGIDVTSDFTTQISTRRSTTTGAQGPYISTDSGATWTRKVTGMTFLTDGISYTNDVAVASGNSNIMYAANQRSTGTSQFDALYKSTDRGETWSAVSPADCRWNAVECSSNGSNILAMNIAGPSTPTDYNGKVVVSTNGGSSWTVPSVASGSNSWRTGAMSADGTRMYAIRNGGGVVYRSSDTGATWASVSVTDILWSIACSSDGLTVLVGRSTKPILSRDGGVTFSTVSVLPTGNWLLIGMSEDARTMVAGLSSSSYLWVSKDSGQSWVEQRHGPQFLWETAGVNSNGTSVIACRAQTGLPWLGVPPA
jgi:photosystem II stability/assembly factor-like uncharacterized protein